MKVLIGLISFLLITSPLLASEGPCLGYADYDSDPLYSQTQNPFNGNQLPPDHGGAIDFGVVLTRNRSSNLNLRSQASVNSAVLTTIPSRAEIPLYGGYYPKGNQDNYWWWFTEYNGKKGWVRGDYICNDW